MTPVPTPERPTAPAASGLLGLPSVGTAALLVGASSLLGAPSAVQLTAGLALALTGTAHLLAGARGSAAPAGWRRSAAAVATTGTGAALAHLALGSPAGAVIGAVPGLLLGVVALTALRGRIPWPAGRAQLGTAAVLFVVATMIGVHVVVHPATTGPGSPPSLVVAGHVVPLVVAGTAAAALLLRGTVAASRRRVAGLLLGAHALAGAATVVSVLGWAPDGSALTRWALPAVGGAVVLLCAACRLDTPRPETGDPRLRVTCLTVSLLPHALVVVAGTTLLLRLGFAEHLDALDVAMGVVGLFAVLAHQVATWHTQRRLTTDLLRSESCFRTLVRGSADPVVILDDRLRVTFASRAITDLLGRTPDDVVGRPIAEVVHPDDTPALSAALTASAPAAAPAVRTARIRHADGRWRLIQATVSDLRADPDVGALVLYCRDVTGAAPAPDADLSLLELSVADPATGLPNRSALVRRLAALRAEGVGRPRSLALLGVTGLERLAPEVAGAAVRDLAGRLTRVLRGEDWLARATGGTFAVVAHGSIADAEVLAARLVATVDAAGAELGAAAGVTALSDDLDPCEALRQADLALRAAGPGRVHRYEDAARLERQRRETLRADLAGALDRGELRVVFQPVVDVVLHRTVSVEALLRWRHPVFGEVPPATFVPLAEESPLITGLGRWVLTQACRPVAALPGSDVAVAVNVSARQVRSGSLVSDVLAALESSGLPAGRLLIELTESMLLDDEAVLEDLEVLRRLGVRVAVDDFGSGWSSLAYLVGLPIDVLKMDRQFLAGVEHDPQRQALCRSVLHLGSSLDLPVVVEGVTTDAELDLLRDMGHRYLQGYVLSRPLEVEQLAAGNWPTGRTPAVSG
ncbi:putative bifunctional diguanylate cyclase/phosphodiesterase [Geodermatophilus sp. SYSU D01105]